MTTHLPYPPQQQPQPPPPANSTAPPWAPPPAVPPPAPFGDPHLQLCQLLVPYPEEMQNAARPAPPAWWPVVGLRLP